VSLDPRIRVLPPRAFLAKEHFARLFGEEAWPEFGEAWGRQGGFLARQQLAAATAIGRLPGIAVAGPLGGPSRVELPLSLARPLGLEPPVRHSGETEGAPRATLIGPRGHLELEHGVICLARRLECSPENARRLGLLDGDTVVCLARSRRREGVREAVRDGILTEVFVRVSDEHDLELHIDRDDADALRVGDGDPARLLLAPLAARRSPADYLPVGRLVGERDLRAAREQGKRILIRRGMLLTPSAREQGRELGLLDFEE
jgi:putative phosphotransacetylase